MTLRTSCRTGAMKSPRRSTDSLGVGGRYVFTTSQRTGWNRAGFGKWPNGRVRRARLGLQLLQDLERVSVWFDEVPRPLDLAVGTHEERRTDHAFTAPRPLAPRAVGVVDLAIGVGEQIEVEPVLLLECLMRCGVVLRYA